MRIAIANASSAAVETLRRAILSTGEDSVAWVARDGEQTVRQCARHRPDLLLLDVRLPVVEGVEVIRRIMRHTPCPIVVVTENVNRTSALVFEAMGAGALDAANLPASHPASIPAVALLAKIDTIRRLIGQPSKKATISGDKLAPPVGASGRGRLVAIGASAGGPAALARILGEWPADFPAGIVVVQHVDAQFAAGLAAWLAAHTRLKVRLAQVGESPTLGTVLLAGTEDHLVLSRAGLLGYSRRRAAETVRPSVDVFFRSVAAHWRGGVIAVLLTGMGRDGAAGLKLLREAGHHTIAQDEASSAVYGMPKAAAELGAATEVLPLDSIAPRVSMILAKHLRT